MEYSAGKAGWRLSKLQVFQGRQETGCRLKARLEDHFALEASDESMA